MLALIGFDQAINELLGFPSGHPSPEEQRENDVKKECHNKGDASDHECAPKKAIEAFAGDHVNDGIDDSSDDCAYQTLPQCSDDIVPIHNSLSLRILSRVLECQTGTPAHCRRLLLTIKVFTPLAQNIHDECVPIFGAQENHLVAFFIEVKGIPVNFETPCFLTAIVPSTGARHLLCGVCPFSSSSNGEGTEQAPILQFYGTT